jgi:hypothetical protein
MMGSVPIGGLVSFAVVLLLFEFTYLFHCGEKCITTMRFQKISTLESIAEVMHARPTTCFAWENFA